MLGSSQLFWYKLFFLAELVLAETLFTFRLKKRRLFAPRLFLGLSFCFLVTWFYPLFYFNALYSSVMFFVIFVSTVLAQKFIFKESWITLVFCSVAAYTTQHIAYQLNNAVVNLAGLGGKGGLGIYDEHAHAHNNPVLILIYAFSLFTVYWFVFVLFANRIKKENDIVIKSIALLCLVALCVLVAIVINAVVIYNSYTEYNLVNVAMAAISSIISCVLALTMQFKLLVQKSLEDDLNKAYQIIRQEKKQYDSAKTNIDLINLKCHDLKHQIRAIGKSGSLSEAAIGEIEKVISIYDSGVKTGNEVLDTILTEKSLACNKNNISLTCVVDGKKLGFMNELDLYTLFGNAFDNAIEAVMALSEEKRVISLITLVTGNLLSVVLRNFCGGNMVFEKGLPLTTQVDKQYHGFGLKSIQQITEKYNGNLSVFVKDEVFNLDLLFDLAENAE